MPSRKHRRPRPVDTPPQPDRELYSLLAPPSYSPPAAAPSPPPDGKSYSSPAPPSYAGVSFMPYPEPPPPSGPALVASTLDYESASPPDPAPASPSISYDPPSPPDDPPPASAPIISEDPSPPPSEFSPTYPYPPDYPIDSPPDSETAPAPSPLSPAPSVLAPPPPGLPNGMLTHQEPAPAPAAPFAGAGPSKSSRTLLIAGVSVGVSLCVLLLLGLLVFYANKKRKKAISPSTEPGVQGKSSQSRGLSIPFNCCPIIIQLAQPDTHVATQHQHKSVSVGADAVSPSTPSYRRDEVHGEEFQEYSTSPNIVKPLLPAILPPSPVDHPRINNFDAHMAIQSFYMIFTYQELEMATNGFSDENFLGQGGFGCVYKGVLLDLKEIAVKKISLESKQGDREFQAEVETIGRVHHRNLVSLVGFCIHEKNRLLVYEFMPNKTLEFHLHGEGQPNISWSARMKLALCAAKGIAYLHEECSPKIIHRDIKTSNILVDYNYEAKVSDFGLAKISPDDKTHLSTRVIGTYGYLSPEYANSGKITEKSDVFSFGVVLLELITGKPPTSAIIYNLLNQARPMLLQSLKEENFDSFIDPKLQHNYNIDTIKRMIACATACTQPEAQYRPTMTQVARVLEGSMSENCMYDDNILNKTDFLFNDMKAIRNSGISSSQESSTIKNSTISSSQEPNTIINPTISSSQEPASTEYSITSCEHEPKSSVLTGEGR